jgi:hypothetical protein
MALLTLPFPTLDRWQYETTLDDTVYQIRGTKISPPDVAPYFMFDLLTADNEPIELGMKAVLGTRYAFRSATEDAPQGVLFMVSQGAIAGDVPSVEELESGKVLLVYDTAI